MYFKSLRFMGICLDMKDHICLVCEFIPDGSVLDQLNDRGFSEKEKYDIVRQASAGVKYDLYASET